jgi:hypothetical protein
MLIRGDRLNDRQRALVLSAFVHRWTIENRRGDFYRRFPKLKPTCAPVSDRDWIDSHAFHFVKDGSRLMFNRHHAEPHYLATSEEISR